MLTLGWALAAVVGALSGVLIAPVVLLSPNFMDSVLVFGFTAAILGGLDSPIGAVVGGVGMGLTLSYIGGYLSPQLETVGALGGPDRRADGPSRGSVLRRRSSAGCEGSTWPTPHDDARDRTWHPRRHPRRGATVGPVVTAGVVAVAMLVLLGLAQLHGRPATFGIAVLAAVLGTAAFTGRLSLPTSPLLRHLLIAAIGGALVIVFADHVGSFTDFEIGEVAYYLPAVAGLNLLTGYNGQLSLGHGALMAVGAYTGAVMMAHQPHVPIVVAARGRGRRHRASPARSSGSPRPGSGARTSPAPRSRSPSPCRSWPPDTAGRSAVSRDSRCARSPRRAGCRPTSRPSAGWRGSASCAAS